MDCITIFREKKRTYLSQKAFLFSLLLRTSLWTPFPIVLFGSRSQLPVPFDRAAYKVFFHIEKSSFCFQHGRFETSVLHFKLWDIRRFLFTELALTRCLSFTEHRPQIRTAPASLASIEAGTLTSTFLGAYVCLARQ